MGEDEVIAKNATTYERPLPALRDERGDIEEKTLKELLGKINEELDELKAEIYEHLGYKKYDTDRKMRVLKNLEWPETIEEEAADVITAITTLCEALGIDEGMRNEAQRRVNAKNRERGRL